MTQPAKGQEPSMEEILASIRRIIADDDSVKPPNESPLKASEPRATEPRLSDPLPLRPATLPPRVAPPPRSEPAPVRPAAVAPAPAVPDPPARQGALDSVLSQLQAARPAPAEAEEPASDILDLTEQMAEPEPGPGFRTIDGQPDVVFDESPPEPPPLPPPPRAPRYDAGERGLVSAATSAVVDSAFNSLAQTVLVQNGRTLEDLVREMLRPMLKTWLDDNLPSMVERLVRAEIERVSRGRG
jgi:uncharacterized protein